MRTLHELPKFQDRWGYLYLEHGVLNVDAEGLKFWQKDGVSSNTVHLVTTTASAGSLVG